MIRAFLLNYACWKILHSHNKLAMDRLPHLLKRFSVIVLEMSNVTPHHIKSLWSITEDTRGHCCAKPARSSRGARLMLAWRSSEACVKPRKRRVWVSHDCCWFLLSSLVPDLPPPPLPRRAGTGSRVRDWTNFSMYDKVARGGAPISNRRGYSADIFEKNPLEVPRFFFVGVVWNGFHPKQVPILKHDINSRQYPKRYRRSLDLLWTCLVWTP